MKKAFVICLLLATTSLHAQDDAWTFTGNVNFGASVNLVFGKKQRFPALKAYAAFSAVALHRNHIALSYGPSLSIYTKTIGANLNPLVGDIQIDFGNSFTAGAWWGSTLDFVKLFRTIHTGDYYNFCTNKENLILLGTNIILNNHRRQQIVGSISASFRDVSINYYNDGGVPIDIIPLGDNFDRYWTGGAGIFVHTHEGFNRAELNFDQFTGYTPLMYELANLIGINVPLYENKAKQPANFNTSTYQLRIFTDPHVAIEAGVIGSLTSSKGVHYGIQDGIHIKLGYPLHPNYDVNRFYIGGSFLNRSYVPLQR